MRRASSLGLSGLCALVCTVLCAMLCALLFVAGCSKNASEDDTPEAGTPAAGVESAAGDRSAHESATRRDTADDETAQRLASEGAAARQSAPLPTTAQQAPRAERKPNRLLNEKSPYLLQHAYNPVDWYPWGDEAFEKARRENKPIFLSIGYSTCHWCHVMERESFEHAGIAAYLNEHFVPIKVDREERPDIDRVYMAFVQATTGGGGWPMSVWLTPNLEPFYGGTYFPPERRGNRPGFLELLHVLHDRWVNERDKITTDASRIVNELRQRATPEHLSAGKRVELSSSFLARSFEVLASRYDERFAGFGQAPKFPRPYELLFLHRVYRRSGEPQALEMSKATLRAMANGGIYDHLAGGLHRYSVDDRWRLPHFEKMLYDQAQFVMALVEAYVLSGDDELARVARKTLDYVQRDLTGEHGGFYSAEDADSAVDPAQPHEKEEGAFYVWSEAELDALLDADSARLVKRHYGIRAEGNTGSRELAGRNVLYVAEPFEASADSVGLDHDEAARRLSRAHELLLQARAARPRPHLDDKVLTAWNGLMISAFARAAGVLGEERYLTSAQRAAHFVVSTLWDESRKRLLRRYRDGEAGIDAFNVDYAYLVQGLLDLYEVSFDMRWMDWAVRLTDVQLDLFEDPDRGAFFESTGQDSSIYMRNKEAYDGAQPTSNSVTALNLLRLGEMTDSARYRAAAQQTLQVFASALQRYGTALPAMLLALDFEQSSPRQIIIAGEPGADDTRALLDAIHARYIPNKVLLLADGGAAQEKLAASVPFIGGVVREDGRATAYVCQNYACQLPVTGVDALNKLLDDAD